MNRLETFSRRLLLPIAASSLLAVAPLAHAGDSMPMGAALTAGTALPGAAAKDESAQARVSRLAMRHLMARPHSAIPEGATTQVTFQRVDSKNCEPVLPPSALTAVPPKSDNPQTPG